MGEISITYGEIGNQNKTFVGLHEKKRRLLRPRCVYEKNFRMHRLEIGHEYVDSIHLA
jgi:hypothetical protein